MRKFIFSIPDTSPSRRMGRKSQRSFANSLTALLRPEIERSRARERARHRSSELNSPTVSLIVDEPEYTMTMKYLDMMMTDSVRRVQKHYYGHAANIPEARGRDSLSEAEAEFISTRDSFYLGTVSETG